MCFDFGKQVDPVICSDGKTYCRYSVYKLIDSDFAPSHEGRRLAISGNDALLRTALFEAHPQQRIACAQAQQAYAASMDASRRAGRRDEACMIATRLVHMLLCTGEREYAARVQAKLRRLRPPASRGSTVAACDTAVLAGSASTMCNLAGSPSADSDPAAQEDRYPKQPNDTFTALYAAAGLTTDADVDQPEAEAAVLRCPLKRLGRQYRDRMRQQR